eukprot:gnl/TRDRNA2_/TRDRNA2_83845_c0_seq1.p1 gnl/TRDRNA2_/TRDRNA2_83845_c0~~gnl/TRDRNA2_/TRDRNA2_83845_c0_seq1.p1  ORF type:complete len:441 (+),score=67.86 gnl/TRDRNA2_/TRDRNA2_83845_c0_seq1:3-1325(+)
MSMSSKLHNMLGHQKPMCTMRCSLLFGALLSTQFAGTGLASRIHGESDKIELHQLTHAPVPQYYSVDNEIRYFKDRTKCVEPHQQHECYYSMYGVDVRECCSCESGFVVSGAGTRTAVFKGDVCVKAGEHSASESAKNAVAEQPTTTASKIAKQAHWPTETEVVEAPVRLVLKGGTKPVQVEIRGELFVRKTNADGTDNGVESLANELYTVAGVPAAHCRYYPTTPAHTLCRWMDNVEPLPPCQILGPAVRLQIREHFVFDALLQNYDILGGGRKGGNIVLDQQGRAIRLDNGGSLSISAMGKRKHTKYDCNGTRGSNLQFRIKTWSLEPFALWDFQVNSLYQGIRAEDIVQQAKDIFLKQEELLALVPGKLENERWYLWSRMSCLRKVVESFEVTGRPRLVVNVEELIHKPDELPQDICTSVRTICNDILASSPGHLEP